MAEPFSTDLRERVVAAVKGGTSRRQAAAHFRVGVSSAIRWVAPAEACGGDVRPKRMGGDRRSAAIEAQAETILSLLAEQPDTTLAAYQEALAKKSHRFSVREGALEAEAGVGTAPQRRRSSSGGNWVSGGKLPSAISSAGIDSTRS